MVLEFVRQQQLGEIDFFLRRLFALENSLQENRKSLRVK